MIHLNPKRISIGDGYHGCHGILHIMERLTGIEILPLDCPAEALQPGDVIHIETPLNPSAYAYNLEDYAKKAHSRGAYLTVDGTFAPPPLQDPFKHGADLVMHSGTKYFGGHSDMLCGVLVLNPKHAEWVPRLMNDRLHVGSVLGNMEGWLGIRSIRTLEVRVERQSQNVEKIVNWLQSALTCDVNSSGCCSKDASLSKENCAIVQKVVDHIEHTSLQTEDMHWLKKQMPNGWGPVFSIVMKSEVLAKTLPSKLALFHHATSLGGVESLIEWRAMSDAKIDKRLLRVSVGIEGWEDLRNDLLQALKKLGEEL
jgi:cystathionine beta-lyase